MKLNKRQKISLVIWISLLLLNIFSQLYLRNRIQHNRAEMMCYVVLSSAYDLEGEKGIDREFERALENKKYSHLRGVLNNMKVQIKAADNPAEFLQQQIQYKQKNIHWLRIVFACVIFATLFVIVLRIIMIVTMGSEK